MMMFRMVRRKAGSRPHHARRFEISFRPDRSHNGPRLAPFSCASSAEISERRFAVSSYEKEPATSSSLDELEPLPIGCTSPNAAQLAACAGGGTWDGDV